MSRCGRIGCSRQAIARTAVVIAGRRGKMVAGTGSDVASIFWIYAARLYAIDDEGRRSGRLRLKASEIILSTTARPLRTWQLGRSIQNPDFIGQSTETELKR